MKKFRCDDMMCGHCVSRIDNALTEANIGHQVDLETKTVTVEGDDSQMTEAAEILDDLGFTPVEIG